MRRWSSRPLAPAGAAGVGGPLALGEVVARGRVEVQVGVHRGEGHELRWDARTGQAELTAKPGVLVRLRDGDRGLLWEGVKVTIDEPRGTYRGVGGRFRRDGVSPR
jgi:hypothetical protein